MEPLLYVCPSCEREATVPHEYVGQVVQCPHCDQLFVATPPAARADEVIDRMAEPSDQVPYPSPLHQPPPLPNPALTETIPATQDTYQQANTLWEMLTALAQNATGEVWVSDDDGTHEPGRLLALLSHDALEGKIAECGSDEIGEYVGIQTSGLFGERVRVYRIIWSPTREGWAGDRGGTTLHYFIPKTAMREPPHCGDKMLVSLCKRAFQRSTSPMHRNHMAKRCSRCLERRGTILGYEVPKQPKRKAVRITLTNAQAEAPSGKQLLALISALADDRVLEAGELRMFRESLNHSELQQLPATGWLKENLDTVLADGYVTREEYYAVVFSILRVLPPPVREDWERRMRSGDRPATEK